MIRSLFSAVSGLTSMQEAMDVIGDNIANVNTDGFKASDAEFNEAFSQTEREANDSDPIGLTVGLGVEVSGTVTNFSQGAFETTNITSNVAISGNGFFVIDTSIDATTGAGTGTTLYTRAGDFTVDSDGYLRTSNGYYVMGYSAGSTGTSSEPDGTNTQATAFSAGTVFSDFSASSGTALADDTLTAIEIPTVIQDETWDATTSSYTAGTTTDVASYSVGSDGAITVVGEDGTNAIIGYISLATFGNENGLAAEGEGYYSTTKASGTTTIDTPNQGNAGGVQGGAVELSNSDVATDFSDMIIIQNGYNANAKVITVSNEMLETADNLIQ